MRTCEDFESLEVDLDEVYRLVNWTLFGWRMPDHYKAYVIGLFGGQSAAVHECVLFSLRYCTADRLAKWKLGGLVYRTTRWAVLAHTRSARLAKRRQRKLRFATRAIPERRRNGRRFYDRPKDYRYSETLSLIEPLTVGFTDRERLVYHARFFDNRSFNDIAKEIGVSHQRVHQIYKRVVAQLRSGIAERNLEPLLFGE